MPLRLPYALTCVSLVSLVSLFLALICVAVQAAESPPSGLALSNYRIYSVHMDTTVRAPATGPRCTNVRVWHALPTHRPWSQMNNPYGTLDQHAQPAGVIEAEKDNRSTHIFWNAKSGQLPNAEMHYISDFRVVSPDRRFDWSTSHVTWTNVLRCNVENNTRFSDPVSEVAQLAEKLKYNKEPCETVIEFSKWIKDNLTYDANCSIDGGDVVTILNRRRGHCLHFMSVFGALCNAANLPCRAVKGLNLRFPSGNDDDTHTHNDYTNGHVWAEVNFPDIGWVEVEPSGGDKCFTVPATYVQNNTSFQNDAVWVTEQGQAPRMPRWVLSGGKYVSDYGVDHKISFTEVRR